MNHKSNHPRWDILALARNSGASYREDSTRRTPGIGRLGFLGRLLCLALIVGHPSSGQVLSTWQNQQAFVDLRFGMFIHFNLGTFTNEEWATPNQNPLLFNPTGVHPTQWANAAKSAGMTFAVLTTKHHDGFALWPTKYGKKNKFGTYQNVMYSQYPHDIVKMYVDSFRAVGVTPCLYFSIWDRTEGIDSGTLDSGAITPAQMATIEGELTELLTNYGTVPLIMFDGWTWMMGRQQVAYQAIRDTVRAMQPNILICDHNGLTQPFEEDILNFEHFNVPSSNTFASTQGNKIYGSGWFWHTASFNSGAGNGGVKSASSIGSMLKGTTEPVWCNYLLDCPPDTNGIIESDITTQLTQVPKYWTPNTARKTLPDPGAIMEYPVTPVGATASSTASGFKAYWAIDGHNDWVSGADVQRLWQSSVAPTAAAPQWVTLDLGHVWDSISYLQYMPSQARTTGNDITTITGKAGFVSAWNISTSVDGKTFTQVATGTWPLDGLIKKVQFPPVVAQYVRLEATATGGGGPAVIDEIVVGSATTRPRLHVTTAIATRLSASTHPLEWRAGQLVYSATGSGPITITIRSVKGAVLSELRTTARPGENEFSIPVHHAGLCVATVQGIGNSIQSLVLAVDP